MQLEVGLHCLRQGLDVYVDVVRGVTAKATSCTSQAASRSYSCDKLDVIAQRRKRPVHTHANLHILCAAPRL